MTLMNPSSASASALMPSRGLPFHQKAPVSMKPPQVLSSYSKKTRETANFRPSFIETAHTHTIKKKIKKNGLPLKLQFLLSLVSL